MDTFEFFLQVLDESLVKEEIMEPESEGDVPEAGFDYGSLVSDLGVEGDGETKDHPNLPLSSTYRHASEDQPFNSQAGPSGLQGVSYAVHIICFCFFAFNNKVNNCVKPYFNFVHRFLSRGLFPLTYIQYMHDSHINIISHI